MGKLGPIHFPPFSSRPARLFVAGALAILIVAVAGWLVARPQPQPPVERTPSGGGPRSFARAITEANATVEGAALDVRTGPGDWLVEERLANALIARARLTGSFADYAAAQAALDRAFAAAPKGAGPHPTQLALDFAMHRLDRAEETLDAIDKYAVPDDALRTEATLTRGDLAFYHGDYAGALKSYRSAGASESDPGTLLRMANHLARTGQPDQAIALIDRCEATARLPNAHYLADLALRRGTIELQRGRLDAAGRQFDRAAELFPGWWLASAHRAQMLALSGEYPRAIAAFLAIVQRTPSPEAMDALAALYRASGDRDRSTFWADQARMIWNERLRLFPEASYGHAVEHLLAFGDPATALDLARRDHANRPYGLTATALAWALIANNEPRRALAVIGPVLRSQWVSAESHLAASQAHLLLGEVDQGDAEHRAAIEINPHAADRNAALLWFGH